MERFKRQTCIVVAGDEGTGKSSLISAAFTGKYSRIDARVRRRVTMLHRDTYPDFVPNLIIEASSNIDKISKDLWRADVIVLTYAFDQPETLERISSFWLPELRNRQAGVRLPVIVVGCKLDRRDENTHVSIDEATSAIMDQFHEIETCLSCSAIRNNKVREVFFYAQRAFLYPTTPLFDKETQTLKPRCQRALKRIFIHCDQDDGKALNHDEFSNHYQLVCFDSPMPHSEYITVLEGLKKISPEFWNSKGITLSGFLFIHARFIKEGRKDAVWNVLWRHCYNNNIEFAENFNPPRQTPDQSVELTKEAIDFLTSTFDKFAGSDKMLSPHGLDDLFSTAPESPWVGNLYEDAVEQDAVRGLSLDSFLSEWALMTLLNPSASVKNMIYIGFHGIPLSATRVTRKRSIDRKRQHSYRNVLQCFIFGSRKAGKSALLNSFLQRQFSENYNPTDEDRYAVNVVHIPGKTPKYLVLKEISEVGVTKLLANKESLASCDVAVFVHDRSDEASWKASSELMLQVATHGEKTGFEVPSLIIGTKDDLKSVELSIQDSNRVSQNMGVKDPIAISVKSGDLKDVFCQIVRAAELPHLSIPETENRKIRKQYKKVISQTLVCVSVGGAVIVVGVTAYRLYAARRSVSD